MNLEMWNILKEENAEFGDLRLFRIVFPISFTAMVIFISNESKTQRCKDEI